MKNKYLIAFDLDGTVLPKVDFIEERTVNAFRRAREAGHIPVIASARHFLMFKWIYDAIGLDTPVCAINGARIFNPKDPGFKPYECCISRELTKKFLTAALREGVVEPMYIELNDDVWHTCGPHNNYYGARIEASQRATPFDISNIPDIPASRIIMTPKDGDSSKRISKIADSFGGLLAASWDFVPGKADAGSIRMSVSPSGADKWLGVSMIADYYGIPVENIYAFGDMWNDFSMLKNAGHGYALKGSDAEHKAVSKYVTKYSCAECGVAEVIEREILG